MTTTEDCPLTVIEIVTIYPHQVHCVPYFKITKSG
jgi:hypothetical protein